MPSSNLREDRLKIFSKVELSLADPQADGQSPGGRRVMAGPAEVVPYCPGGGVLRPKAGPFWKEYTMKKDANANNAEKDGKVVRVNIPAPNLKVVEFKIRGTSLYVQNKFSSRVMAELQAQMEEGKVGVRGKKKAPRNFRQQYQEAMHVSAAGWKGIPAPSFRNSMISACRLAGFKMTVAKLTIFVLDDGLDADDGTPLVRITKGEPQMKTHAVRNASGVMDLRARPTWDPGWEATLRIRFDDDQLHVGDVANLLSRAGQQVGVGAGRPDSRESNGIGWGLFTCLEEK
jgi:hypothetical protein